MDYEDTICYKHNTSLKLLSKLKRKLLSLGVHDEDVYSTMTKIGKLVRSAKKSGISMENRLYKYHDTICTLGYTKKERK